MMHWHKAVAKLFGDEPHFQPCISVQVAVAEHCCLDMGHLACKATGS